LGLEGLGGLGTFMVGTFSGFQWAAFWAGRARAHDNDDPEISPAPGADSLAPTSADAARS
jgi:hypothetical protein